MNAITSQTIMSTSSWGRNIAQNTLGINLPKTNMSAIDVLELYSRHLLENFEYLPLFIDELNSELQRQTPTFSPEVLSQVLKSSWNSFKDELKNNPVEFNLAKAIVVSVHDKAKSSVIGRKVIKEILHSCIVDIVHV